LHRYIIGSEQAVLLFENSRFRYFLPKLLLPKRLRLVDETGNGEEPLCLVRIQAIARSALLSRIRGRTHSGQRRAGNGAV